METVSEIIGKHREQILEAWSAAAHHAVSAHGLTAPELSSLMPEYLKLLGQGVNGDLQLREEQVALIEAHLGNRLRAGFDLSEILTEFAVLGRCVSLVLEAAAGDERPAVGDVARLYSELYQTSVVVTKIFNEHLLEDEQTMKRYARMLDGIAQDGDGLPDRPELLRARLDEVMAVIGAAMGARAVIVLLLDASGDRQTTAAATGSGARELELYARSLEATDLGGTLGVAESAAGSLKLPAALCRAGVGGLLRAGYVGRGAFRCVLYVAIDAERAFTASEVRRVEGLGRALTVHLDNVHLHASLREKMDELRLEREHRERMIAVLVRAVRGPLASARSSASRLLREPAGLNVAAIEVAESLARLERVVDDLLTTTPAVRSDVLR